MVEGSGHLQSGLSQYIGLEVPSNILWPWELACGHLMRVRDWTYVPSISSVSV